MALSQVLGVFLTLAGGLLSTTKARSDTVAIESIQASGNGCPEGSFTSLLSGDKQTLSLLFNQFIVQMPQGTPVKSCNLQITLHIPEHTSLSWYRTEHRGFVDTSGGATGEFWARYMLQGAGLDFEKAETWAPGTVDAYTIISESPSRRWTRCGTQQKVLLRTKIALKGTPLDFNIITVDDQSQRVEALLLFAYRSCS